jgi:diaminopimelate epimerase
VSRQRRSPSATGPDPRRDRWSVEVPGGILGVRIVADADGDHVLLSGPATLVYSGEVRLA